MSGLSIAPSIVRSVNERCTREWGEAIGRSAVDGDVVALMGDLGAGKTCLARGIAVGLGFRGRVTSPTFTVMQVYEARLRMYHVDCYRLSNPDDFEPLGADDWLGLDGLAVIEWAERVTDGLPPDRLDVRLIQAGVERVIQAWPRGPRSLALATRSGFIPGSSVGFE